MSFHTSSGVFRARSGARVSGISGWRGGVGFGTVYSAPPPPSTPPVVYEPEEAPPPPVVEETDTKWIVGGVVAVIVVGGVGYAVFRGRKKRGR